MRSWKNQYTVAIDLTLIPYHGQPHRNIDEIYRSQPKSDTSHFHAYATCYVVRNGHRFTIALTPGFTIDLKPVLSKYILDKIHHCWSPSLLFQHLFNASDHLSGGV